MPKKEYLEEAERLQRFINYRFSGVKKRFAEAIEVSEANASKYINGWQVFATESSFEKLRRVGLNPEWYLTGEGDMIYENKVERELLTGDYKSIDVRVYEAPAHALDGVLIDNLDNLASTVHNVKIREKYLNPDKIIGFRAKGNSMVGRGILDGDLLLVSEQMTPVDNSVVLANINGCIMVKLLENKKLYSVPNLDTKEEFAEYADDNGTIIGVVFKIERDGKI